MGVFLGEFMRGGPGARIEPPSRTAKSAISNARAHRTAALRPSPPDRGYPRDAPKTPGHQGSIVDHTDGWLRNRLTPADLEKARKELDRLAAEAGRDPKSITISVYGQEPRKDVVRPLLDAGADRVVVRATHVETEAEMGEQLERMAAAVL